MARPTERFSAEQIARLTALPFYPSTPQGARELANTLRGCCESEDLARAVIDEIIARFDACPNPGAIRRIAYEFQKPTAPRSGCQQCDGSGWIVIERYMQGPHGEQKYTFAKACSCWAVRGAA